MAFFVKLFFCKFTIENGNFLNIISVGLSSYVNTVQFDHVTKLINFKISHFVSGFNIHFFEYVI